MQYSVNVLAAANLAVERQRAIYAFAAKLAAYQAKQQELRFAYSANAGASSVTTVSHPHAEPVVTEAATSSIAEVMACIRNSESGDYSESSHLDAGSGAYQYVPSTWQTWAARAGYSGYAYAYQAPPEVQDAVTEFVLTNGGAHNWDPSFGADSCTVGMP